MTRPRTVGEALRGTAERLGSAGIENPSLEAERLLEHVLKVRRIGLYLAPDRLIDPGERDVLERVLRLRCDRTPLQYLTGEAEFWSLPFFVDPRVLIPRPETEVLVQSVLDRLRGIRGARIADFGTGSGCVAVSLAHELPGASVFATDRSPDAIRVALGNARRNGVAGRVRFAVMDLGEGFGSASDLDALACNPPYVPTGRIPSLQVEVRAHEPRMALDGGEDGLRFYPRLAQAARASLRPGGWLALEVGQDQAEPVREIAAASGLEPLPAIPDLTGRPRVVLCRRG